MINYTSLDVSKRLAEAGFKERGTCGCWLMHDEWQYKEDLLPSYNNEYEIAAYRSDTLMEWLLEHKVAVFVDKRLDTYYLYLFHKKDDSLTADTLPDALGEVVLAVLAKEAEHGKQG